MTRQVTGEQRRRILEMLDGGIARELIASALGVSVRQVAAVAAHQTMGTYSLHETVGPTTSHVDTSASLATHDSKRGASLQVFSESSIALGEELDTGDIVTWDPVTSTNPHALIVGESGFGKTYTAKRLIAELARSGLPSVVFDYGQGFTGPDHSPASADSARVVELELSRYGIGLNPLQIFPVDSHGPATVAQRVADTFVRVYPRLGVQQHTVLRQAVLDVLADAGITVADPRTWTLSPPPFRDVEQKLTEYALSGDAATRRAAASAGPHVSTLFFFNTFRSTGQTLGWADLLTERRQVWILQLAGLEPSVERAVTEFLLWSLMRHFEIIGPGPLRCFVVLDEAHKLAFGPGSPVEKFLREGRKFGLAVILASQQPEDFTPVAFANTAMKIVFQIADHSGHVARLLSRKVKNGHSYDYIATTISTLPRGCAYVVTENLGHVTRMFSKERPHESAHSQVP